MNIASLELCRELFGLSRWGQAETHLTYYDGDLGETEPWDRDADNRKSIPAYDLGYLLRKMPLGVTVKSVERFGVRKYSALYDAYHRRGDILPSRYYTEQEAAPEDAVCKLATELFQQKVLKKEKR